MKSIPKLKERLQSICEQFEEAHGARVIQHENHKEKWKISDAGVIFANKTILLREAITELIIVDAYLKEFLKDE